MGEPLSFTLPWPPSVNSYWRSLNGHANARVVLSERGRKYRKAVGDAVLVQSIPRHQLAGRLEIFVLACPPDKRKRDLDNLWKSFLDALTHAGVVRDDSDFDRLTIQRGPMQKGGALRIELAEIQGEQAA